MFDLIVIVQMNVSDCIWMWPLKSLRVSAADEATPVTPPPSSSPVGDPLAPALSKGRLNGAGFIRERY